MKKAIIMFNFYLRSACGLFKRLVMRLHVYHIVYSFRNGSGTMTIYRKKRIKNRKDLEVVREFVSESTGQSVAIQNWMSLKPTSEDYEFYFETINSKVKDKVEMPDGFLKNPLFGFK
jgi:hypothetical protein